MPKNKVPEGAIIESVEKAWREQGEIGATKATIIKYAKVLDMTDSGRDIKPLVSGMMEQIDRLKMLETSGQQGENVTPLYRVINDAQKQQAR
jgi:hypothetical protein